MTHRRALRPLALLLATAASLPAQGQDRPDLGAAATPGFHWGGEFKLNGRDSFNESFSLNTSTGSSLDVRPPSAHGSLEVSNVALIGEGHLTPHLFGRAAVHILDLYNRNPTPTGATISVREAWLCFGRRPEALEPLAGTSFYVQVGKAPHFTRQSSRRLESYGLWGTALARLEDVGLELGGSVKGRVHWRAQVSNGNPLYIRDVNAQAGSNGPIDRTNSAPAASGFPILYEARADDFNLRGQFQYGGGLGARLVFGPQARDGIDLMAWAFARRLGERPTSELDLLRGFGGPPLPIQGKAKSERGLNLEARLGGLRLFSQIVRQQIATLERRGFEAEAAVRIPIGGVWASGDAPVLNWVQPALRVSRMTNDFAVPSGYFAPSLGWQFTKYDIGVRVGIVQEVDLTLEYSRNDIGAPGRTLHPDEFLTTLRLSF